MERTVNNPTSIMIPVYDKYSKSYENDDYIREMPNSVYELELRTERWLGIAIGVGIGGLVSGIAWAVYYMI